MYYMLQKCSILVVAHIFFLEPTKEHNLINISRKAKLAHTSVKKHLQTLLKERIIIERKEIRNTRTFPIYKANVEGNNYLLYKKISNIEQIHKSKMIEKLVNIFQPKNIILYGSYSRGEDIESSDIDIFVDTRIKNEIKLDKYERALHRRIDLKINKFENLSKELQNNILNGVTLHGFVEV